MNYSNVSISEFNRKYIFQFTKDLLYYIKLRGGFAKYIDLLDGGDDFNLKTTDIIIDFWRFTLTESQYPDPFIDVFLSFRYPQVLRRFIIQIYSIFLYCYQKITYPVSQINEETIKNYTDIDPTYNVSIQTLYDLIINSSSHLKYFVQNINLHTKSNRTVLFSVLMCYEDQDPDIYDEFENIFDSSDQNKLKTKVMKELKDHDFEHKWNRRFQCFSKFNNGVQMDIESWYSVTLEKFAEHQANRCDKSDLALDPFCGVGGNVIQMAKTCGFVIAGDICREKLIMAKNNSAIYRVENNIDFIISDCRYSLDCIRADSIILSPPWGGPSYIEKEVYSLETDMDPNIHEILDAINPYCKSIMVYIPKNSYRKPLQTFANRFFNRRYEIEKNIFNDHFKALSFYMGKFVPSTFIEFQ